MTLETREARKQAKPIVLNANQIIAIKDQPDAPEGRRDKLMVCLALDHGLRVSELALLRRSDFNLGSGTMTFERPQIGQRATFKLSDDTLEAARKYFEIDDPGYGSVWQPGLPEMNMLTGMLNRRIRTLGNRIAIENLSLADLRHTWATNAAQNTPLDQLIYAGGWISVSAALPYLKNAKIAIWK